MKSTIKNILLGTTFLVNAAAATLSAQAFIQPKLIVQPLCTKPEFARSASQDLLLRTDGYGSAYLYVEQGDGALLRVFDVTDPNHMKLAGTVTIEGHGAYNFVAPIGRSAELISFRDGSGTAVVDFGKPKRPHLSMMNAGADATTEPLGTAGYLSSSLPQLRTVALQSRDIQVVERGRSPRVVSTLTGVTRQVDRPETGTIFLLSDGKVTVVRQRDAEYQHTMDQEIKRNLY